MAATAFDTHEVVETLTTAGVSDKQAKAHKEVLMQATNNLVTKEHLDLKIDSLENHLTAKMWRMQFTMLVLILAGGFALLQLVLPSMVTEAVMLAMGKQMPDQIDKIVRNTANAVTWRLCLMLAGTIAVLTFLEQVVFK